MKTNRIFQQIVYINIQRKISLVNMKVKNIKIDSINQKE